MSTKQQSFESMLKAVVLLGLAIYFAYIIVTGNVTNYINVRFGWLSYVAVVLFGALGVAVVISMRRQSIEHRRIGLPIILVVGLPLVLGTLIPSQPLGASAINGQVSTSIAAGVNAQAISKDPLSRNVLDWARLFADNSLPATFDGEQASVIGFVYQEPDFAEDHFMVARFTMSCCVADASPIGIPVHWADAETLDQGVWVRINGIFEAGDFRDELTPILQAESVELVEQPEHPYLYP